MDIPTVEKDDIICQCHQVSEATIRSCIVSKNLSRIEHVTKACEAGGGCHSCHILIQLFIDEHLEKRTPMETLVAGHAKKVKKRGILSRFFRKLKTPVSAS
ncbi:MAG: (2Fe-2S)-binding protein [Nitrospinaceae bacterium]